MTHRRLLLLRRRSDFWLLALGLACISVLLPLGKVVFLLFAVTGLYLAIFKPGTWRHAPLAFTLCLAAYCVWTVGLVLLRGDSLTDNRTLSYAGVELGVLMLPLGLCLVRRPLDAAILGARVGVVALAVATPIEFWLTGDRVGLGRNEAILGFVAAAVGLIARLRLENPIRMVPDGRWWFYLSFIPALLTQTRAAWGVYLLVGLFDLFDMVLRGRRLRDRRSLTVIGIGALTACLALVPVYQIVEERVQVGISEVERFESTGAAVGSLDVRIVMWRAGLSVLGDHPLIGVGSPRKVAEVAERASDQNEAIVAYYTHLHNMFLDEALNSGLIGLALLLSVFAAFLIGVFRAPFERRTRETALAFVFLVFTFGSFHGVLLNEWMIIVIGSFMSIALTQSKRIHG